MAAGEVQGEHRREVSRCRSWKDLLKKKREQKRTKEKTKEKQEYKKDSMITNG